MSDAPTLSGSRPAAAYGRAALLFHWAIALLVLAASGLALFREAFERYAVAMISAHKVVGGSILVLALARLVWRLTHKPTPLAVEIGPREAAAARAVHYLLYALTILVPLAGWLFVSLAPDSRPLDYRGARIIWENPLAPDDEASQAWHEVHELLGFALIGLVGIHISAALRHVVAGKAAFAARMYLPRPKWLRPLVLVVLFLWLVGLSLDLLGVRLM